MSLAGIVGELFLVGGDGVPHLLAKAHRGQDLGVIVPLIVGDLRSSGQDREAEKGGRGREEGRTDTGEAVTRPLS